MLTRSWLFVPGNSAKRIEKAEGLEADVIIYDLEDAVGLEDKHNAREQVSEALKTTTKNIYVRVNAIETPFFLADLEAIIQTQSNALRGIVLPKASETKQLIIAEYLLSLFEQKYALNRKLEIVPLIETALGAQNGYEIAKSSARIKRLAFGAVDYALDANVTPSSENSELLYVRSQIVNASRAAGIEMPIDTVYTDFKNFDGMQKETEQAMRLGFGGKLVIHPNQLFTVNECFSPSEQEIKEAEEIIKVVQATGQTLFQLNGKMVDEPVIKKARKICEAAQLLVKN